MDQLTAGQVVNDKYKIVATIGRGGMGNVYQAEQMPLGRRVALKVLRSRPGTSEIDPAFKRRFFLEASLCSKLSHPNIITIFDYGEIEGAKDSCFIAMEFLEGETLHARLKSRERALTTADAVLIAVQIARGLREAHRNGIVHRDLKPSNVMLVADEELGERVKIVDFGLVKQVEGTDKEDLTREGSFLGSPKYMAPEQIEGQSIDARTDLYSLGVILYQCLAGRPPFTGESPMRIFVGHLSHAPPTFADVNPNADVPEPLERFVRSLLEKSPAARPASADQVVHELRALQATLGLARSLRRGPSPTETAIAAATVRANIAAAQTINPTRITSEPSFTGSLTGASMQRRLPSVAAPPLAPKRRTGVLLAGAGLLALLGAGAVVATKLVGRRLDAARLAATTPAAPRPVIAPRPGAASHQLMIESEPPGAWVRENGAVLGATPMVITLDPSHDAPRTLTVQADGYLPYTLVQPPATADARVHAVLARPALPAAAAPDVVTVPHHASTPHHRGAHAVGASSSAPAGEPDATGAPAEPTGIRFER